MDFSGILDKFRELKAKQDEPLTEEVRDDRLVSLRRQRQKQLNEIEREQLKQEIKTFNKDKNRRELWGFVRPSSKNILKEKRKFLIDKKPLLKSKPKNMNKKLLMGFLLILLVPTVLSAIQYTQDYNNPLTRSMADGLYASKDKVVYWERNITGSNETITFSPYP